MHKSKFGKILSIVAIACVFLIALLIVLGLTKTIEFNRFLLDLILVMGIFCIGCASSNILVKLLEISKKKKPLYVALGMVGVTCLLWIIFIFIGQSMIDAIAKDTTDYDFAGVFIYAKFAIIVTIQTFFATTAISCLYSLKKKMYAFQGITYISYVILDFWLTALLFNWHIDDDGFSFTGKFLLEKGMLTIVIVSFVFSIISAAILRRTYNKTFDAIAIENFNKDNSSDDKEEKNPPKETGDSFEERLKKLEYLKSQGLITEEEYLEKKKKILEEL